MKSLGVFIASLLWAALNFFARALYSSGVFRSQKLPARVISVGNLQAGGAGKTPLVACIAREALERRLSVAILTRGYGGAWSETGGILKPGDSAVPQNSGDEAALLKTLVPQAWIGIGADRGASFAKLLEARGAGFDLVILDDGFQHWKIQRDLDIVAITDAQPWQQVFREFGFQLKKADLVIWTKGQKPCQRFDVKVRYELPAGGGKSVLLVTGVAQGSEVKRSLLDSGYKVLDHIQLSDHFQYSREQVQAWLMLAREKGVSIAVTGKDWVKWHELGVSQENVIILEPTLRFEEGREIWNQKVWVS